jgi:exosome complex exonuclease DIS3/RRP44
LTPEAKIVDVRFTKSVIASKAAFTYEEAQIRKDDPYVFFGMVYVGIVINSPAEIAKTI